MNKRDTIDKVVDSYFAAVAIEPFEYKGKAYTPHDLVVSPDICRGYTCPPNCGACCPRFTLDYLPSHAAAKAGELDHLEPRTVRFDGRDVKLLTDWQHDNDDFYCRHLIKENGRCGLYRESKDEGAPGLQPFSCDFELLRFLISKDPAKRPSRLTSKLYGRSWQMKRVDGIRGTLCEMTPPDPKRIADVIRNLTSLKEWCEHFGVVHCVDRIVNWLELGPGATSIPLRIEKGVKRQTGFFS
tara:strand:+ start:5124 stop:5846 length:723 start_codon:yes stop_codon:yes gene_type:complete